MKFEDVLLEVNGFGRFQKMVLALSFLGRISIPCHFVLTNFIATIPSHHCNLNTLDHHGDDMFAHLTAEQRRVVSIPLQEDGTSSSCLVYSEPQFHLLNFSSSSSSFSFSSSSSSPPISSPLQPCPNGWVFDNSTFKSTLATQFNLVCDKKGLTKATATIFFVGVMFGAIFFGVLCDKYGRRSMLLVSYVSAIVFSVTSALANSYVMFAVFRFLTGFGITGISISSIVLTVEWADIEHRTFIGVFGSVSWTLGNMMLAGIAYLITDWRILIITVTSPLLLAILTWWWIPESARWLLATGRTERAHYYLQKCADTNRRQDFSSRFKPQTLATVVATETQPRSFTYLDLVKTPRMRRLALYTGVVWYGVASTYYGISLNVTGFGLNPFLTHFIYAAIELPSKLIIYFCLDVIGRRYSQVATLLLTGTCIFINILTPKSYWSFRTIVAVLGKGLSEASFTTVFLYTTELYPTVVRQNGIGYTSFMARLGASFSPLIMLMEDVWKPLPEVVFCAMATIAGLVALLLPETHNTRLPETIQDIEQTTKRSICLLPHEKGSATQEPLKLLKQPENLEKGSATQEPLKLLKQPENLEKPAEEA